MQFKLPYFILVILVFNTINYSFTNNNTNWKEKVSSILLEKLKTHQKVDFIVYLSSQINSRNAKYETKNRKAKSNYEYLKKNNLNSQREISDLLANHNYKYKQFFIVNAIMVSGDMPIVQILAEKQEVEYIAYDSPVKNDIITENYSFSQPSDVEATWGIRMIKADSVWQLGYKGEGVVVGGQDTGYDWTHIAIHKKYRGYINETSSNHNYNWHDAIHEISLLHNDSIIDPSNNPCGLDATEPCDDHSHGTHTMGTMVGKTDSMLIGVAPKSKWIGCRNMERGWGKPSTYIECFEWFMAPTDIEGKNPNPALSPDVINNSWGCPIKEGCDSTNWQFMELALDNLRASGVFVVVSAGNDGIRNCGSISKPSAMFKNSFTVGATRQIYDSTGVIFDDVISSFSSRGPVTIDHSNRLKPDISAPGQSVLSSVPGNKYRYSSGTSMAGPHVVGVVALMLSANPELKGKVDLIADIIKETADPKYNTDTCRGIDESVLPNSVYGYGRINALAAVKKALELKTSTINHTIDEENVLIYPNPTKDYIRLKHENNNQNISFTIFNQFGKKVFQKSKIKNDKINISSLKNGIYFLKIKIEGKNIIKKLIKI